MDKLEVMTRGIPKSRCPTGSETLYDGSCIRLRKGKEGRVTIVSDDCYRVKFRIVSTKAAMMGVKFGSICCPQKDGKVCVRDSAMGFHIATETLTRALRRNVSWRLL